MQIDTCPECGSSIDDTGAERLECGNCSAVIVRETERRKRLSPKSRRLINNRVGTATVDDEGLVVELNPDKSQIFNGATMAMAGLGLALAPIATGAFGSDSSLPLWLSLGLCVTGALCFAAGVSVIIARSRPTTITLREGRLEVRRAPGLFLKQILYPRTLRIRAADVSRAFVSSATWAQGTTLRFGFLVPTGYDTHFDINVQVGRRSLLLARLQNQATGGYAHEAAQRIVGLLAEHLGLELELDANTAEP